MKTVSVVIPAYNEERRIEATLKSILNQTVPPDEVIVADNESEDDTRKIAERYADKVITVDRDRNVGFVRNAGIKEAKGEIIYNTDGDVIWTENVIESTKKAFEENPDLNALTHTIATFDEEPPFEKFFFNTAAKIWRNGWGASMAFPKEVWEKYGGFKNIGGTSVGQHLQPEDVEFWDRIPEPKAKLDDAAVRAEGSEWKIGFAPMAVGSSALTLGGLTFDNYILAAGGVGSLVGEIGHQVFDTDGSEPKFPLHHDQLGALGLAGTWLYDKVKGIDKKYRYPAYAFFGGLILQHILTEGITGINHQDRRSVRDEGERFLR